MLQHRAIASGPSPHSIFLGFEEYSGGGAEVSRSQAGRPASLLAGLLAAASTAPTTERDLESEDSRLRSSAAAPAQCACGWGSAVPARYHECHMAGGDERRNGAGADLMHSERTQPVDIPVNTYFRNSRQARERQRLWAALVCYRLHQERQELLGQHHQARQQH
ncbi:hypothetical protein HYH02_007675 [Chlamydomonas schloesseri]|uniref:Uncharacterized protein n=1 Tax=Chlamydomonas schloesseri TaxID=2026947 RepID=A0A835WHN1_9CHLO|nr:hypothetical protein HYH02_007675 [Chlamydomonas schloesseri]|eukprot:KAG2447346.1 hypothetical protein HYH02_007675 [Chlamydomonas schloesseri]